MPLHDLRCPACGAVRRDVYIPLMRLATPDYSQGYKRTSVLGVLPLCGHPNNATGPDMCSMEILPPRVAVDLYESASTTAWIPDGHGGQKEVPVHSLRDIRKIEAETAKLGQPHVFRDYNQDRSNRDQNVHGNYQGETLSAAAKAKYAKAITRHGTTEPVAALGPGVAESDTTQFADR